MLLKPALLRAYHDAALRTCVVAPQSMKDSTSMYVIVMRVHDAAHRQSESAHTNHVQAGLLPARALGKLVLAKLVK